MIHLRTQTLTRMLLLALHLTLIFLGTLGAVFSTVADLHAQDTSSTTESQLVYVLTFEGAVTPVLDKYILDSITAGEEAGAELIILQLDTPGGSVDVTKGITPTDVGIPGPDHRLCGTGGSPSR